MAFGFNFKNFFKSSGVSGSSGNSVVGVDIGSSSIKVVQLRKEKERAILETYGEIALGPYANQKVGQAVKLTEEKVSEALRDLLREANVKSNKAIFSIPLKSSFVTTIVLPAETRDNLASVVPMEARRYIPIPLSEVVLDWWMIPETSTHSAEDLSGVAGESNQDGPAQKKMIQVLLIAIHRDVIDRYKNIASGSKMEVRAYEIESFASIRSVLGRETSPVAMVDFGSSTTKVSVVDYGIIRHSHLVDRGSQEITLAIAQSMSVPFEKAEAVKREHGLSKDPVDKEIVSIMEPALDYIAYEVGQIIGDYERKEQHAVGRVILAGGGSILPGALEFFIKKLNVEVSYANPFAKVAYAPVFESVLKKVGPSFTVAVGLALREM